MREVTKSLREKYNLPDDDALVVVDIDQNGEAYSKGIREGDMIKGLGLKGVKTMRDFKKFTKGPKDSMLLLVKKPSGESRFYTLNK